MKINEDGGASSGAPVNVDSGCAGTSGNPPVTVKQQKKIRRTKIGIIPTVKPL